MFKRLLVPLDGSALAEQAIGRAAAIARAAKAQLDLVLVHQPFPFDGTADAPWNAAQSSGERRYLERLAEEIVSGSGVPVTHAVLHGETVDMICQRIDEVGADLVVMTSHGRTGLSRAWLGSVANSVLRWAATPVLMLRPIEGKSRQDAAHHLFKRMLMPVDGSALAAEIFEPATMLAKCCDARVTLLRVVQPIPLIVPDVTSGYALMPPVPDEPLTTELANEASRQLAELARRLESEHGVKTDAEVVVDVHVASAILAFAAAHDIDLIAMSTHGRGASRLLLGSVADKVLRAGGAPMLLYRPSKVKSNVREADAAGELARSPGPV